MKDKKSVLYGILNELYVIYALEKKMKMCFIHRFYTQALLSKMLQMYI